jgi:CheY-specific phosphatase CheX
MDKQGIIHLLKFLKSRVEGVVQNGQVIPTVTQSQLTNNITYMNVGTTILNLDETNFDNTEDIVFVAESGNVGSGGLTVQLYDKTNAVEITTLVFTAVEDDTIKTDSIKSYLEGIGAGRITLEVNIKKTAAGGAVTLTCSTIEVFGV